MNDVKSCFCRTCAGSHALRGNPYTERSAFQHRETWAQSALRQSDIVIEEASALHAFDAAHPLPAHAVTSNDAVQ